MSKVTGFQAKSFLMFPGGLKENIGKKRVKELWWEVYQELWCRKVEMR